MKWVIVYLRLYRDCLLKAARGIAKSPWTLLLPIGLALAFLLVLPLAGALGFLGGIVLALLLDAVYSCYLYFTGEVVAQSKVRLSELRKSFGAYFWSVMNLFFVLWIVNLGLGFVLARNPQRATVSLGVWLLTAILLNAAPEVIYLRCSRGGVDTIQRSVKFIHEHWIEWFVPNLLALGAAYLFASKVASFLPPPALLVAGVLAGALFHVLMVFRGHLFLALDGSSHRQRMFRQRNASAP